jgi:predicted CoA-binding protein
VAEYLKRAGYHIIPVNPGPCEVLGEKCHPTLESIPGEVDIVDIFRRSEFVPEIVEAAIRKGGVKAIWMQEGVYNAEAARRAEEAGIAVMMDRCLLKDHRRFAIAS